MYSEYRYLWNRLEAAADRLAWSQDRWEIMVDRWFDWCDLEKYRPNRAGYWWGRWPTAFRGPGWHLYRVFLPAWIDQSRTDLQWGYLDGCGGDDFPPGSQWIECSPPTEVTT